MEKFKTLVQKFDEKLAEKETKIQGLNAQNTALLGTDNVQGAEQLRRAIQLFANSLSDEQALEIATVYPEYKVGSPYAVGEFITYGVNAVGDPQLYKVIQDHTSQEDWTPSETPSLYEPIGLNVDGYPVWSQPSGAHDAYNTGDIVDYNGTLYESLIDSNVYSPEVYPTGWKVYIRD
jgi:hypothetical protein